VPTFYKGFVYEIDLAGDTLVVEGVPGWMMTRSLGQGHGGGRLDERVDRALHLVAGHRFRAGL
jgi:hypothetical protein